VPNWSPLTGGVVENHASWETFTQDELDYLNTYYGTNHPTRIFSDGDMNTILAARASLLVYLQASSFDMMKIAAGKVNQLIRDRFTAAGMTNIAEVRAYWSQVPQPTLNRVVVPITSTSFDFETESRLTSDVQSLLEGGNASRAFEMLRGMAPLDLLVVARRCYNVAAPASVGQATLMNDTKFVGSVTKALTAQTSKTITISDQAVSALVENLKLVRNVSMSAMLKALTIIGLKPAFDDFRSRAVDDFAASEEMFLQLNTIWDRKENIQPQHPLLRQWRHHEMFTWLSKSVNPTPPAVPELDLLDGLSAVLDGNVGINASIPAGVVRAPRAVGAVQALFLNVSSDVLAREIARVVRENVTPTGPDPYARQIIEAVYPMTPELKDAVGGASAADNLGAVFHAQQTVRDQRVAKPAALLAPNQNDRAERAAAQVRATDNARGVQAGTMSPLAPFAGLAGGAAGAIQMLLDGWVTGPLSASNIWVQKNAPWFAGTWSMLTNGAAQGIGSAAGRVATAADSFLGDFLGAVATGDFAGLGDRLVNGVINPLVQDVGDFIAAWAIFIPTPQDVLSWSSPAANIVFGTGKDGQDLRVMFPALPAGVAVNRQASAMKNLTLKQGFASFLGLLGVDGDFADYSGFTRGAAGRARYESDNDSMFRAGNNTRYLTYIDDKWLTPPNSSAAGTMFKPEIKLVPNNHKGPTFTFRLLPAIPTHIPANKGGDGQTVPFANQGIKYTHIQNIAKISVPGGAPVFQSLGIKGEMLEVCGALTSFGYRDARNEFQIGAFPFGASGEMGTDGARQPAREDPILMNANERQPYHALNAYNQGENQLLGVARDGREYIFTIAYTSAVTRDKATPAVISIPVLVEKVERIQQRRDKVFYKLTMVRTQFPASTQAKDQMTSAAKAAVKNNLERQKRNDAETKPKPGNPTEGKPTPGAGGDGTTKVVQVTIAATAGMLTAMLGPPVPNWPDSYIAYFTSPPLPYKLQSKESILTPPGYTVLQFKLTVPADTPLKKLQDIWAASKNMAETKAGKAPERPVEIGASFTEVK
jgi:hypothetical protein